MLGTVQPAYGPLRKSSYVLGSVTTSPFLISPVPTLRLQALTLSKNERAATLHRIDIRGTSQRALVFSTPNGAKTIQLAESGLRTESIALYGMKL